MSYSLAPLIRIPDTLTETELRRTADWLQQLMANEGIVPAEDLSDKSARTRWTRLIGLLLELGLVDRQEAVRSVATACEISEMGAGAVLDHLVHDLPVC